MGVTHYYSFLVSGLSYANHLTELTSTLTSLPAFYQYLFENQASLCYDLAVYGINMRSKFILFFICYFLLLASPFASMGRFGGWSNFYKPNGPSSEQVKNATFDEVPENLSVEAKPRGALSEQSSKYSGILYTSEDKYKLPPVNFKKVYSDVKDTKQEIKVKPVIPINGLNIIETGTYIAN